MSQTEKKRRRARLFPAQQRLLVQLGENLRLARKRRHLSLREVAERTGLSRQTLSRLEQGSSGVSLGHLAVLLGVLRLDDDLAQLARDDVLGQKLRDIELLERRR